MKAKRMIRSHDLDICVTMFLTIKYIKRAASQPHQSTSRISLKKAREVLDTVKLVVVGEDKIGSSLERRNLISFLSSTEYK